MLRVGFLCSTTHPVHNLWASHLCIDPFTVVSMMCAKARIGAYDFFFARVEPKILISLRTVLWQRENVITYTLEMASTT